MRPQNLRDLAERVSKGGSFEILIREFLDEFYRAPTQAALAEEPAILEACLPSKGRIYDAYLAATAESLAGSHNLRTPSWAYKPDRQLHHPWFANEMASLRAVLLHESPAAFRSRNLFVSENALSRA